MAKKAATLLVKLISTANTGFFYVKRKNPRKLPQKLQFVKHDPRVNQHVLFTEQKLRLQLSRTQNMSDIPPAVRQPAPPFTRESAAKKVQAAEDAWNTCNPEAIAKAYTADSQWRNRKDFFQGTDAIVSFLKKKWEKEHDYRLRKTLWAFDEDKIAVRFEYEFHDSSGKWYRAHGNENWKFDEKGYMKERWASINDVPIQESERQFRWPRQ